MKAVLMQHTMSALERRREGQWQHISQCARNKGHRIAVNPQQRGADFASAPCGRCGAEVRVEYLESGESVQKGRALDKNCWDIQK